VDETKPASGELLRRAAWAEAVAGEVGALLAGSARSGLVTEAKGAKGIVTELDRRGEALIAASLADAFPGDGIEAEEGTRRPATGPWRWIVDPLDGTTNFVAGLPLYAVSLACLDAAGRAIGLVHAPALGVTFQAVRGSGAGPAPPAAAKPAATDPPAGDLAAAVFLVNKAYRPAPVLWEVAGGLMSSVRAFRTFGCVSLDLALVAAGRADGLVLLPAERWDVAAGLLLLAEAGLVATSLDGSPDPDGTGGILATRAELVDRALALLKPAALAR
jgi:myo-inositol-1(or 4)-monophosphatase